MVDKKSFKTSSVSRSRQKSSHWYLIYKKCLMIKKHILYFWHLPFKMTYSTVSFSFVSVGSFFIWWKTTQNFEIFLAFVIVPILRFYLTITWGAAARTARVATIVNRVKVIKQRRSRTMAANFQSLSIALLSSSSRILSVITFISLRMRLSSLGTPLG